MQLPQWSELFIKLLLLAGMLAGLFSLIIPVFPGITVIWVLVLLHGVIFGFSTLGIWLTLLITVLAIAGWLSDNILSTGKALQGGAHWSSLTIALTAGLVSSFFLTPIGGILVTLLALFLAEYYRRHDRQEAWEITKSMMIGWGWAFVARFSIGLLMIGVWAIWAFL